MKPKVYLRADGNSEIGMGHVIRSIALGSMLSQHFECLFYTRFVNIFIEKECEISRLTLVKLNSEHEAEFLNILQGNEIVVLDNYFFSYDYQKQIKCKGSKLVCIDDIHKVKYVADMVINHSPAVKSKDYNIGSNTRLLLGLKYVLLRKPFLKKAREIRTQTNLIKTVLVCFGGSDLNNLSVKYLEIFLANTNYKISLVVGLNYKYYEELLSYQNNERVMISRGLSQVDMLRLIESIDLAFVPASSILFEVLALHKPFITGHFVENQREISDYYSMQKVSIGNLNSEVENINISDFILNDYSHLFDIDGRSDERLIKEFMNLS